MTGETGTFGWNEDRQALTVKNERIRGTVSITKKLTASGSDAEIAVSGQNDAEKTAVFEIRNGKGETVDTITIDLTKGETGTSKELEYGSYTIYETTQPDVDRWHFVDVTVDGVSIRGSGKTVEITENGQVIEVEAQNIYERDLGNLKITKNFKGDMIPGKAPKDLSFTIEGPEDFNDNTGTMTVSYSDFSVESGGNMAYVLEQIPTGMYTVTETGENLNGHTVTVTYTVEGKKTEKTEKTESGELEVMTAGPRNPETDGISTSDINVTNEYVVERTRFGVEKVWEDDDDRDHLRPGSVGVHLLADGADGIEPSTGESVERKEVLSDANSWQMIWDNLPKYDYDGKEIAYSVEEYETEEGSLSFYEAKITEITLTDDAGEAEAKLVTNRHTPSDAEFTVTKEWDDSEDQDGLQPAEVKVTLLADGETFDGRTVDGTGMKENGEPAEVTLNASNDWTYTWKNLPKNKDGYPIAYSVTENAVEYYETIITVNKDGAAGTDERAVFDTTVTNRHTPSNAEYEVEKDWYDNENSNGTRPESIDVRLLADGEEIDTVTLSEDNEWAYKWTELPKYKDHGQLIDYSVEEVDTPSAYRPAVVEAETEEVIGEDVTYTAKITNTLRSGNLQITKTGAGDDLKDTDEFTFEITLTAGGDVKDDSFLNETYKAARSAAGSEDREETVTFKDGVATVTLKYDETLTIMGLPEGVKYTIKEVVDGDSDRKPDGTVSFETEGTIVGGITQYPLFVNRKNSRTEITVHKKWNDMDDHDKVRPTELEVQLVRHVHFVNDPDKDYEEDWLDPVILNKDNSWTYTWTDLETTEATGSDAQKDAASSANSQYADVSSSSKAERASASLASRSDAATESDALYDEDGHLMDGNIFNDMADGFGKVWEAIKKTIATLFGLVDEDEVEVTYTVREIGTENLTKYYTAGEPEQTSENAWEIVNTHMASTTAELNGVKFMKGRDLKNEEFTFNLTAADGAPEPEKKSVKNGADGKFSFGTITFTKAGTYTYTISEQKGTEANVTYDETIFTVTIKVTEDAENGTLTVSEPEYTAEKNNVRTEKEGISFTNTYTPPRNTPPGGGNPPGGHNPPPGRSVPPTETPSVPEMPASPIMSGRLPKTGENGTHIPAALAILAVLGALFGFGRKKDDDDE